MDRTEVLEKQALMEQKVQEADVLLVGIGEEWNEDFAEIDKYPMLTAILQEMEMDSSLEWLIPFLEQLYIQEHIERKREGTRIQAYQKLYQLIKDKNYFIVTTCIDSIVGQIGFDKEKIVEPCGSYHRLQCSQGCCAQFLGSFGKHWKIKKVFWHCKYHFVQNVGCRLLSIISCAHNIMCRTDIRHSGNVIQNGCSLL